MLPNFLIIGAAKCATTSMASSLDSHPEAMIVRGKEPHFFSYDDRYAKGIASYAERFDRYTNELAVGDASTSYSRLRQHPHVLRRLRLHLNSPKIIYMVRHPIERIESAYIEQMSQPHNRAIRSINEAVQKIPMMIDSSRYWETFNAYRSTFGEKNTKVLWFDEYVECPGRVFASTCRFLGIDDSFIPSDSEFKKNTRDYARSRVASDVVIDKRWDPKLLRSIKKVLKKDTHKFLHHFDRPLNYWR